MVFWKELVIIEAAIDLASLAGLHPSGVICEILKEDGTMARLPDLIKLKEKWGLKLISIASLIQYRHQRDQLIEKFSESSFLTEFGEFASIPFAVSFGSSDSLRTNNRNLSEDSSVLVRSTTANVLVDALGLLENQGQPNLIRQTMKALSAEGTGVLLYMEPRKTEMDKGSPKSSNDPSPPLRPA